MTLWQALKLRALRALDYNPRLHGFWGAGLTSASGASVTADTALTISAVFACVALISRTLASISLVTYRRTAEDGRERARDYFLYPLLHDAPNEEQTSLEFLEMLQGHVLLRGNAYVAIDRAMGVPVRLVPLHPDNVRPERDKKTGAVVYRWRPTAQGVEGRDFSARRGEIMHVRSFIGRDGITGMSVIEAARNSMGLSISLEEHASRLFSNGAVFSGVLTNPTALKPDRHEQLRKDFAEKYSGGANAYKPLILESGMDWKSIGMKADDSQFLESRAWQISDIGRWFLVAPHMIGDMDKSTSWGTGIEQQQIGFVQFTMRYWGVLWEQAIRRDLIPPKDRDTYFSEFLFDALLRGDSIARASSLQIQLQNGALSPDEWRALENRNPIPGGFGKQHIIMANMTTLDKLGQEQL